MANVLAELLIDEISTKLSFMYFYFMTFYSFSTCLCLDTGTLGAGVMGGAP
jgi:hypothetical protein